MKLVILLFALVWINDAGAFFVGSAMGKKPLAPRISPKKTWEGTLGGFAATVILALLVGLFSRLSVWQGLFLGVVLGVAGPVGDLVESALKRGAGVKDSGAFLPGHGGVLDRIDSVIFCAPILYYFVVLSHYTSVLHLFGGKS
jgi:phosphatidate cytidylyltransferase